MRIGVFGGSFDPPHIGHLAMAKAAMDSLELEEVIFVPARQNPMKSHAPIAGGKDRLEMTRLSIQDEDRFAVSDQEIHRKGPSYTIDTIAELQAVQSGEYWLIMGLDSLLSMPEWKSFERLAKLCRVACFFRGQGSSEQELQRIHALVRSHLDLIDWQPMSVSSTDIRLRIQEGKPWDHLTHPSVAQYIRSNRLYLEL